MPFYNFYINMLILYIFISYNNNFFGLGIDKYVTTNYNICSDKERSGKMSPLKKGSKLTNKPKDTMFRVRMDKETMEKLTIISEELKITKSDVVRKEIDEQYEKIKK